MSDEAFEEWASEHLRTEVTGVTDWTLFRECWEAAQEAVLRGQPKHGEGTEETRGGRLENE